MNPKESKKIANSEMNKLLPSDLLKDEEEDEESIDSNSNESGGNNYILEEQEPEKDETFFPNVDSSDSEFRVLKTPTTRYSDSYLLNLYRPTLPMSTTPRPQVQGNFSQFSNQMQVINQSFVYYSPQIHQLHQINKPYGFDFPLQLPPHPNSIIKQKTPVNYFEPISLGYQPSQYQSLDSLLHLNQNSSINSSNSNLNRISHSIGNGNGSSEGRFNEKRLQAPSNKRKYNSSGNISNRANIDQKRNTSKRKRSSLFLNKSENKAESDIKDFKCFCDGLKCEMNLYICSQIGSRIMQKYLTKFPPDILTLLINKLSFNLPKIMVDKYGNYFSQKLIRIASKDQRVLILQYIQEYFHVIAKENTGTHVLQTFLEVINSSEEEAIILNAITRHELEMAYDCNGTHVIQQILLSIEESKRAHLNHILIENFKELCLNSKGVCVIKKLIASIASSNIRQAIIKQLSSDFLEIAQNPYGNYLIQFIIEEWKIENCPEILQLIIADIAYLSMHKFSSNIIENLLSHISKDVLSLLIHELFTLTNINTLISSKYGKFILSKCIVLMDKEQLVSIQKELIESSKNGSVKGKLPLKAIMDLFNVDTSGD